MTLLIRWEPLREFSTMQDRMNRVNRLFRESYSPEGPEEALTTTSFAPPVDIYEDEHNITLKLEVPGIDEKDIDVRIDNNALSAAALKYDVPVLARNRAMKRLLLWLSMLSICGLAAVLVRSQSDGNPTAEMVAAGQKFLGILHRDQRSQATIAFTDEERMNWHYIPRERRGVPFKVLTPAQRDAADLLLQNSLSEDGLRKARAIRRLEEVLHARSGSPIRDPELYYVSIFGAPSEKSEWGWRMEGHHLSLNFAFRGGRVVGSTPFFFGANPATVDEGPQKGTRVLAAEEEMGRALLHTFTGALRERALINVSAPADIVTGASQRVGLGAPAGVSMRELSAAQGKMLTDLIELYARRLRKELADEELSKLRAAGMEKIFFAWAGGGERGQPHYYRIQGPTFVIEYDNTQDHANHIHTVWRDFDHDFGVDPLHAHYLTSPHHRQLHLAH